MTLTTIDYEVKDLALAEQGKKNIEWAFKDMPVLTKIKARFQKTCFYFSFHIIYSSA